MTKKQKQVLTKLADGQRWRESDIGASNRTLQNMYYAGWVTGAGYPDKKGTGNYPDTREWWITDKGREALSAATEDSSHSTPLQHPEAPTMASLYTSTATVTPSVHVQDTSGRRTVLVYLDPKGDSALILDLAEAATLGAALTAAAEPLPAD